MNEASQQPAPKIRDPHAPVNMLHEQQRDGNAADAHHDDVFGSSVGKHNDGDGAADAGFRPLAGEPGELDEREVAQGLAQVDPLTVRPRISSRVLCTVFGLLFIAAAFGVWWLGVCTEDGQSYDDMVRGALADNLPQWAGVIVRLATVSWLVIAVSGVLAGIGVIIALIRRRWWLVGQSVVFAALCYAASFLKDVLPRPFIINTDALANSAPSGHTIIAAASAMILLFAVPRAARAIAAIVGVLWSGVVGVSVICGQWHRPTDVIMSLLLVGGIALLTLALTRASGMDAPGLRVSSASIQIVGTVLITAGLLACLYAAYVIWQVQPGLNLSATWALSGAIVSTITAIAGIGSLTFGLTLAMRQITAAPLSRLGMIGAPPAPPKR